MTVYSACIIHAYRLDVIAGLSKELRVAKVKDTISSQLTDQIPYSQNVGFLCTIKI